jgi:hypothetical protein
MSGSHEGGCQCGEVRYRIDAEPLRLAVCHCTDCQRQSGSAFGMSLLVASDSFRLLKGRLKTFSVVCDSGRTKHCAFCPDCGTRIYHQIVERVVSVKPGTLDDTSWLAPAAHYWTGRKQPWFEIAGDLPCFSDDG